MSGRLGVAIGEGELPKPSVVSGFDEMVGDGRTGAGAPDDEEVAVDKEPATVEEFFPPSKKKATTTAITTTAATGIAIAKMRPLWLLPGAYGSGDDPLPY